MMKQLKKLDPVILLAVVGLIGTGLIALYSTSQSLLQSGGNVDYFTVQLKWVGITTIAMLIVAFLPNRLIYDYAYFIYGGAILVLLIVLRSGTTGYGATRWLHIGPVGFQPSEIAKIATLFCLAKFLSDERPDINELRNFAIASLIVLLPFILVARQPDLGTALVFAIIALPIFFWAGLSAKHMVFVLFPLISLASSFNIYVFVVVIALIVAFLFYVHQPMWSGLAFLAVNIGVGLITPFLWGQLQDYQKQRILTFWNPEADPLGAGYQIIQSKVAIGSGGIVGKGFLQGSQTQLRFLPEQHTDFIFAVIGEEFGFIGVLIIITLFTVLLMRIVQLSSIIRSKFNALVAVGIGTMIGFHMFVNIGMTIGLCPVTGLPLPFISYGGSALLTNMLMIGLLLNFFRHKFEY